MGGQKCYCEPSGVQSAAGDATIDGQRLNADHAGKNGLDAAAYFMGHGLQNVRCLRGGIDAWAQEVEPKMRRYKLD
jgi:rhodanese-related sulfurtransferase